MTMLNRGTFPRYYIGESIVPAYMPVLERLGAREAVEQAGFVRKAGVYDLGEGRAVLTLAGGSTRRSPVCPQYPSTLPVREFIDTLCGRRSGPASCAGELGHDVDLVVDAFYRSREHGGGWVRIDEGPLLTGSGA